MQTNFLLISDPTIWAMQVDECGEPLVDIRNFAIQTSAARAAFYAGYTYVRESVAAKLLLAQKSLPSGLAFYFSEGHRPITLQKQMFDDYCAHLAAAHPDWDTARLTQEATKFIAMPQDVPPHSTGGAIDITLMDVNGRELDMGSILDDLPDQNEGRNFTYAENISAVGKANREILIAALSTAGFVNYPAEWWHWSYGDKYWAYHAQQPHAIYGSVALG